MRIRLRGKGHDLTLMIDDYHAPRKNWRDTTRKQLESEVGSFVVGLLECANALRTLREREVRRKHEMERFQSLEENALDWQKARAIEQYVTELERQTEGETDARRRDKLLVYVAWAKGKIAWLDPLVAREDPILGRRYDDSEDDDETKGC